MLEDDFTYVLRKALKGHALAPSEAAAKAGLAENEVMAFSRGSFSPEIARKLAMALGLNPEAYAAHESYEPATLAVAGIHRLDLPFDGERVNAWLVEKDGVSILFDTGNDLFSCPEAVSESGAPFPKEVLVTHGHRDHIAAVSIFMDKGCTVRGPKIAKAEPLAAGDELRFGGIGVKTFDLSGHFTPSLGYLLEGFPVPVLVTGDALFAGSMGGCETPALYQHALERLGDVLGPLPDETVVLPGHGPASTLGEERKRNPFLAVL